MTWPEQDPYASQPPYSSTPYQSNPKSGPPDGQYSQYPTGTDPYQQPQPYQQGQQYPPAGYPPYAYQPAASAATNTMAILSLVLAFVFWPAAIVCGHIAKKQISQTGEQGSGLATAGLVIGYIALGLTLLLCGFWLFAVIVTTSSTAMY